MEFPVIAPRSASSVSPTSSLPTAVSSAPLESPVFAAPATPDASGLWRDGTLKLFSPLWIAGLLLMVLRVLGGRLMPHSVWPSVGVQVVAAIFGAAACFWAAHQAGNRWLRRVRSAWICIGASGLLFAAGWLVAGTVFPHLPARGASQPSLADACWIVQQPLLWTGLFLLAWRGRSLGMMRLLTDTLIVVVAAVVLTWSLVLEKRLASHQNISTLAKLVGVYYPVFDIAHLFCALMLVANVRGRPALTRAAGWLLLGVFVLVFFDSISSTLSLSLSRHLPQSLWFDGGQIWSYLLLGMAALVHARVPPAQTLILRDAEDADEPYDGQNAREVGAPKPRLAAASRWEKTVVAWHHAAMMWLPYVATLGVSGVLIFQELHKTNAVAVLRLLPVLSLLLAIVARQMITMWDNLQLAEKLRATNVSLKSNIDERTLHLATLHGITSTLNTSLDRRTVLRVTLEKTITAVAADGGGIWLRDARRDIYSDSAPDDEWTLVHWKGLEDNPAMPSLLRDIAIASAEDESGNHRSPLALATRGAVRHEVAPPPQRLILVPVRWQGDFLGVMGLVRVAGSFSYQDRALVESVALEAGTALQNARLYSEAANRADRDSITALFNHRAVQEELGRELSRCKRTSGQFSIVMMDLNNFKFFNDTYGHPVGDEVLRVVAEGLKDSCRASDTLGRYGGDEFIMVLPDTDAQGTIEACQRIKGVLDARHFEPVPGTRLPISISFGWAAFPDDGDSIHDLLTHADANLYNHKRGGNSSLSPSAQTVRESREELKRLKSRAFGGSFGVLDALVTSIDHKDHYTRHHSEEVTYFSLLVAKEIGYDAEMLRAVRISGMLHDVGKIAVPDYILRHPGQLGREEWEIMQQHPVFGAIIVKDVPNLDPVLDGIRYHHEKWDGSGYPDKLVGENIPELGRLLALGDCYSALTTDRPYRKGWKPEAALEEIERCKGTHFDPRLCEAFLKVMRRELLAKEEVDDYGQRIAQFGDDTSSETKALESSAVG